MKKSQKPSLVRSAALVALSFCALMGSSFAATKPLNYPYGMAIDARGNLYVANSNGNDVLVYSPTYTQLTAKTITKNVSSVSLNIHRRGCRARAIPLRLASPVPMPWLSTEFPTFGCRMALP